MMDPFPSDFGSNGPEKDDITRRLNEFAKTTRPTAQILCQEAIEEIRQLRERVALAERDREESLRICQSVAYMLRTGTDVIYTKGWRDAAAFCASLLKEKFRNSGGGFEP